jgi:hypothetical protein
MTLKPLFLGWIAMLLLGCQGAKEDKEKSEPLRLIFQNFPVDSVSFRIHHSVTGKEVFSIPLVSLANPIEIPPLEDDMYIAVLSWPRTMISHQVYKSRLFDKQSDEDIFEFTKPLFLQGKSKNNYTVSVENEVSNEDVEISGPEIMKFKNMGCKDCDLADEYWQLFSAFFLRKQQRIDSVKNVYYAHVNASNLQKGKDAFLAMLDIKNTLLKDEILDQQIQDKVKQFKNSPVSTFFLFYQLYNHREFDKFLPAYQALEGRAKKTKYYRMLANQYKK